MNANTLLQGLRVNSVIRKRDRTARLVRPVVSAHVTLPLAIAMCAALGASQMQAFAAKHRMMVAGVAPNGIAISDGEHSYMVSETELDSLLSDVERLS